MRISLRLFDYSGRFAKNIMNWSVNAEGRFQIMVELNECISPRRA
jgi:hypothetical protein